jgi:uncharacterized protein YbjQ (UPF0145 family)
VNNEAAEALKALSQAPPTNTRSVTSDLSIDESLLLHSAGWEPTDLVSGVSVWAVPYGTWYLPYGQTQPAELTSASRAAMEAFRSAIEQLRQDCSHSGGHGAVGVDVDVSIEGNAVRVAFTGTAIRPIVASTKPDAGRPFVTDLSTKDFVLLERGGWQPIDLAYGASFVAAPLQRLRQVVSQTTQNTELVNLTQALQNARELAMDRMQRGAVAGATGIVDVSILDGPLHHSRHVLGFICWGTTVRLVGEAHQLIEPELVLPLNDDVLAFEATSLQAKAGRRRG